jgi:hypothetical protein
MRGSIDPKEGWWSRTLGAGAAFRWSAPRPREQRAGRIALAHRFDESPAGYSSAGCSPAEPACAWPAKLSLPHNGSAGYDLSANGNLSPNALSQAGGAVHQDVPFGPVWPFGPVGRLAGWPRLAVWRTSRLAGVGVFRAVWRLAAIWPFGRRGRRGRPGQPDPSQPRFVPTACQTAFPRLRQSRQGGVFVLRNGPRGLPPWPPRACGTGSRRFRSAGRKRE